MKITVKIGYIIFSLLLVIYLAVPTFGFPGQISNSLQSKEPADVESPLRRGYYEDQTRPEILDFYQKEFETGIFAFLPLTYRLNYPPEEAQTLIRDQTKSTFLEEIVHPMRESVFVNGYQPKEDNNRILVNGKVWQGKIILRLVPSNVLIRLLTGILVIILLPVLAKAWIMSCIELSKETEKIWSSR